MSRMRDAGPFRPLQPFGQAERGLFFGRDRETAELLEDLSAPGSVLIAGEAGVGKTSMVHTLVAALEARGMVAAVIDGAAPTAPARLLQAGAAGAVLIVDELGAALDEKGFGALVRVVKTATADIQALRLLFVIDDHDMWRLDERFVPALGLPPVRIRLRRFDEARAAEIIERTVLAGGAYFESGLSAQIAADLARRGPVSPAELQLVAATAVAQRISTAKAYRAAGGAEVLSWQFLERACRDAGGAPAARALAEIAATPPRGVVSLDAIAGAAGVDPAEASRIVEALQGAPLIRAVGGDGYTLVHEWVRPLVRDFTGEARGRRIAARLALAPRLHGGRLLSLGAAREVRRYAGTLDADEERLVRRSLRAGAAAVAAVLAVPLIAGAMLYSRYAHRVYFDARGGAPGASVMMRLGQRHMALGGMPHHPRFGAVIGDSGFARAAFAGALPEAGLLADEPWRKLLSALRPLPRAEVALLLDGDVAPLAKAFEDAALRRAVVDALGAAGRGVAEEIAILRRALADPTDDVRRRAVLAAAALERRAPGRAAELLAQAVRDGSSAIRALATQEIARLPDGQSAPLLGTVLAQTADPGVRRVALDALGEQAARTPAAAAELGGAWLGAARAEVAPLAGRLLDGGGAPADAVERALTQIALDARAPEEARLEALRLLRRRPTPPAELSTITGSPRLTAAVLPLGARLKPDETAAKLPDAMRGAAPLRAGAAAAIGLLPRTADTPKQLHALGLDGAVEVRVEATRALPVLGREALPLLVKAAKSGGTDVERAAVETIGQSAARLGAGPSVDALAAVARQGRPTTRRAAIDALGRVAEGKPGAAIAALAALLRDKAPEVRLAVAGVLGELSSRRGDGGKEALAALRTLARDPDAAVRRRAAEALGQARGPLAPIAARSLTSFSGDADATVRAATAMALGELGAAARGTPALPSLVADRDPAVRGAARRAAQALGPGAGDLDKILLAGLAGASPVDRAEMVATAGIVGAPLTVRSGLADADTSVRRAAAEHAGGLGLAAAPALATALADADAGVRLAAVRGLVTARAAAALSDAARSPDREVRVAALEVLGAVGGDAARAALEAALDDGSERVRLAAARGLAPSGAAKPMSGAADLLLRALRDPARDVRDAAVAALSAAWAERPARELVPSLRDETDAELRFAAAAALARQAETPRGAEAQRVLDEAVQGGGPMARLAARIARAFVGRAAELPAFLQHLRGGG
jgi:HEAT repeat protein